MPLRFEVQSTDAMARRGRAHTDHGTFETPAFMPVGTRATVKGMTADDLRDARAEVVLANAFHLALRPGEDLVQRMGGLHRFMSWDGPILTDSGGFQVFSLGENVRIEEDGVIFRSPIDGRRVEFGPRRAMEVQRALGPDLVMAFDPCSDYPFTREQTEDCVRRTLDWAAICREAPLDSHQTVLGIVQGSVYPDLRVSCARRLIELDFPAYAVGGLMVGEPLADTEAVLKAVVPELPVDRLRYLMGVGLPENIVMGVRLGVDLFDCVIPTRHARNHQVFTSEGRLNLRNARFRTEEEPLDPDCGCSTCRTYSRAYLAHLCREGELLAPVALTRHNVAFYQNLMRRLRDAIEAGELTDFRTYPRVG